MSSSLYSIHFPSIAGPQRTDRDLPSTKGFLESAPEAIAAIEFQDKKSGIQSPKLISSYQGSIDELFFMLPERVFRSPDHATYRRVLTELPLGTRFVVATHESVSSEAAALFNGTGHAKNTRLIEIPTSISFSDWAEDAFLGVYDTAGGRQHLLEPFYFWRQGDSLVADYVEDASEIRATPSPLVFQGGNCLVGDTFWLMGEDYFVDTFRLLQDERPPVRLPNHPNISSDGVVSLFKQYVDTDRELIRVWTDKEPLPSSSRNVATFESGTFYLDYVYRGIGRYQPIFHIDMFITLVGRPAPDAPFKLMVGSPQLAAEVAGIALSPYSLQSVFDNVAEHLQAQGFDVIRNPLPVVCVTDKPVTFAELKKQKLATEVLADFIALGASEDTQITPRDWYHASTNNCLVQASQKKGNRVYLPTFGNEEYPELTKVDARMVELWSKQDFTVHPLGDFHAFARRQGVVHCIKKYLARGD
jgi:hypothetical protein